MVDEGLLHTSFRELHIELYQNYGYLCKVPIRRSILESPFGERPYVHNIHLVVPHVMHISGAGWCVG